MDCSSYIVAYLTYQGLLRIELHKLTCVIDMQLTYYHGIP